MKKIIPIMIALSMLTICFVAFDSDVVATDPDNGLWVNSHHVTDSTTEYSESEHWSYDLSTNTLTLNGVDFTLSHVDENDTFYPGSPIASPIYDGRGGALKIVLNGNNIIRGLAGSGVENGIFSLGSLEFSGSGTLTINDVGYTHGIFADKFIAIKGGTINTNSTGFDVHVFSSNWQMTDGFLMQGGELNITNSIDINGGAGISITGGRINVENRKTIAAFGGPSFDGPFEITGGMISYSGCVADDALAFGSASGDPHSVLSLHDAVLTNVVQDGNMLKAVADGDASFGFAAPATYTVSFDANGGSGTMADVTGVSGSYTLPTSTFTAPAGKEFKCWSVADVEKNVGDSITVTANTTVKAIWQTAGTGYTVTFDANGGTGTMDKKTGVSGEYTLPESTFTAPDGKEFKCWKVGEDEKNAGDKITVSSDITVKAVWKDKSSGGSNNIGLIIGGVIAGIVVVGAVAFFLIRRP